MIRLFVDHPLHTNITVPLTEKAAHYLTHVMRCTDKDMILCFNGTDGEWACMLNLQNKKKPTLETQKQTRTQTHPTPCVLCPALIKKDNMDLVFQKATELGVTDIYPLLTEHTAHPHFNKPHAEAIIKEAAEQSERLDIPILHDPLKIADAYKNLCDKFTCCCMAERMDESRSLPTTAPVAFFVGPEGGWSSKEMEFFKVHPFIFFHSDVGILRAETASIGILAAWQFTQQHFTKK